MRVLRIAAGTALAAIMLTGFATPAFGLGSSDIPDNIYTSAMTKCANRELKENAAAIAKASPARKRLLIMKINIRCSIVANQAAQAALARPVAGFVEYDNWIFNEGTWTLKDQALADSFLTEATPSPWNPGQMVIWTVTANSWQPCEASMSTDGQWFCPV